jgi:hypothetical protein
MRERITTGWHMQRWLRLGFALLFMVVALVEREPVAAFAALFFGAQAVLGIGCCGADQCAPPRRPHGTNAEVVYEEIQ